MNVLNMINKLDNYSNKNYNHLNNPQNKVENQKNNFINYEEIEKICLTKERLMQIFDKKENQQIIINNKENTEKIENTETIEKIENTETIEKIENIEKKQIKIKKQTPHFFRPRQKDSLFWCFYILKNGFANYELIDNKHFVVEKEEKFKYINIVRTKKELMKINKIKPFADIENDLANSTYISIKTFFALCIIENINIILVHKRKIYKYKCSEETPNIVIQTDNTYSFGIEIDPLNEKIQDYLDNYYLVENFDNTLKSITYYTIDDLTIIAKKLMIDLNSISEGNSEKEKKKKITKKDIYDFIASKF